MFFTISTIENVSGLWFMYGNDLGVRFPRVTDSGKWKVGSQNVFRMFHIDSPFWSWIYLTLRLLF